VLPVSKPFVAFLGGFLFLFLLRFVIVIHVLPHVGDIVIVTAGIHGGSGLKVLFPTDKIAQFRTQNQAISKGNEAGNWRERRGTKTFWRLIKVSSPCRERSKHTGHG
jgi:hypothetical protein